MICKEWFYLMISKYAFNLNMQSSVKSHQESPLLNTTAPEEELGKTTQLSLTHFQLLALLSIQDGRLATPGSALKLKPVPLQSASL
jgi:hypothetical protein